MVSLLFGVGSVFANFFERAHTLRVLVVDEDEHEIIATDEANAEDYANPSDGRDGREPQIRVNNIFRHQMAGLSINVLCMLMVGPIRFGAKSAKTKKIYYSIVLRLIHFLKFALGPNYV